MSCSRSTCSASGLIPSNTAETQARLSPVRISSRLTRPPRMALSASMMMDLPAPVSPDSTEKPGSNRSSARWITAIFSMTSSRSMVFPFCYASISATISQKRWASSVVRRITRILSSPASVPTISFTFMASMAAAAALAMPTSVLSTTRFWA